MSTKIRWIATTWLLATAALLAAGPQTATFRNPLLPHGADPWILRDGGFYYYMSTSGTELKLRRVRHLSELATTEAVVVWTPPPGMPYSHELWAPELHRFDGKWYIYFAADAGSNQTHRIWVIENSSPDPLNRQWTMRGKVADATDKWAIDATAAEIGGRRYLAWSGWEGNVNGTQSLYIARLATPYTIVGPRVRISTPHYAWETFGDLPNQAVKHVDVNEGPEFLVHGGRVFLTYSASGCWTDHYALGLLEAKLGSDLLDASSWKKLPQPVFISAPARHAFGTGHNGFFVSPDGTQSWIVYHANPEPHEGCRNDRSPRAQPFTWNADGTPHFGRPEPLDEWLPEPR